MSHLTRRQFHTLALASAAAAARPHHARANRAVDLVAREASARLAPPDYPETAIWGYDGTVPGPELRVAQGARLSARALNSLPQPTSVHWHGIRIENAMDGVAGLT